MALSALEEHISTLDAVKSRLQEVFPDIESVKIIDNTPPQSIGKGAHVTLQIRSPVFKDMSLIRRHRFVSALVDDLIESNRVHAISYLLDE